MLRPLNCPTAVPYGMTRSRRRRARPRVETGSGAPSHSASSRATPGPCWALLAVAAKLTAMNVRMAVGALLARIGEHQLEVAAHAIHSNMHTPQRVSSFVVVEIGTRPYRFPARIGVTILACDAEGPVRTARAVPLLIGCTGWTARSRQKESEHQQSQCDASRSNRWPAAAFELPPYIRVRRMVSSHASFSLFQNRGGGRTPAGLVCRAPFSLPTPLGRCGRGRSGHLDGRHRAYK